MDCRITLGLVLTFLAQCALAEAPLTVPAAPTTQPGISIETHFSPEEEIAPTVVKLIDGAQESVDIAAFAFTHPDIASALIRAQQRGVHVCMITDTTQASLRDSLVGNLIRAGIEVRTRHKRGDQHSKYLIVDQRIVVNGSYNFTVRADERNSENLLVIRNAPPVVKAFSQDYELLRNDSVAKNNK